MYNSIITDFNTFQKVLKRNSTATWITDNISINDNYYYIPTPNQVDSISINNAKNKIALFIPKNSCSTCYDEVYDALSYCNDSLKYEVLILAAKEKRNEIQNIIRGIGLKQKVYYLKKDSFWNNINIKFAPFFSFIDENLNCTQCFIPYANFPLYSYVYLKTILYKYKNVIKSNI